jgi:uncharacterized BrkB/YihY/UPF0761 family membrane protein
MLANTSINMKFPSTQAVLVYLCVLGGLTALALAVALLLLVGYLLQLLFLSVGEACAAFNTLPVLMRFLFFSLSIVLVGYRLSHVLKVRVSSYGH